jgi:hypothetical protein
LNHYDQFLADAGIQRPERLAFRAGGWDHGTTREENALYVEAVDKAGFAYDSSVTRGVFGTRSFRVGAPFGSNIFQLTPSLTEVAACWSLNCGADTVSRPSLGSLGRLVGQPPVWWSRGRDGAFVVVLHFDHLFRMGKDACVDTSTAVARERIDRFFKFASYIRRGLRFADAGSFEDLILQPPRSAD